ncbi:MAG: glycosyl transferase, partial [Lysobacteraceae bacterium]
VTGAVFATRRGVLEEIGGFDQGFSLEFNDVDLCLKIRTAGYRIVYTPFAEMTHSEKASRAASIPPGEQVARFLSRWSGWLQDDPAIHPKMRRDLIDLAPAVTKDDWYM